MKPGEWIAPDTRKFLDANGWIENLAARPVVLLGETHTSTEDHRWQAQVLAAIHSRAPDIAIGFEAFPRRVQPVLDRWVAGELSESRFLAEVGWADIWGFDPELYMPLFDFARMNSVPMIALNVERKLVSKVGREGWEAVPVDEREGVGDPAPPPEAYVASLERIFAQHGKNEDGPGSSMARPAPDDAKFKNFVQAQSTWDRAMAEGIAAARREGTSGSIVGIVGRGHLEYGYGVPHQLADLGIDNVAVVMTWPADRDCAEMIAEDGRPVADAVFAIARRGEVSAKPRGPRLGVLLSEAEYGVKIESVVEYSVAANAGLKKGDVVTHAAGQAVAKPDDLAAIVRRQPHGTWLPLEVARESTKIDIVAKFPVRPHPPMKGPSPHRRGQTKGAK